MKLSRIFIIATAGFITACGAADTTAPVDVPPVVGGAEVNSIAITGLPEVLERGGTATVTATALAANGKVATDGEIAWASSDSSIVVISTGNRTARVIARAVGKAEISASLSGISSKMRVIVFPNCAADAADAACVGRPEVVFANLADGEIYRVRIDGSGLQQLTHTSSTSGYGGNSNPAWSPDGNRIAFARSEFIYIMDADGSNVIRRTSGFQSAAWSPDGLKLAVSPEGIYSSQVYVIGANADDTPPVLISSEGRSPAWSPDGKQIAYVHVSGDDGYHQIYLTNPDGTDTHAITANDGGGISGVSWSPDGKRLAFAKCLIGSCDVYLVNSGGSDFRQLTYAGNVTDAEWSPDGNWIAVHINKLEGTQYSVQLAFAAADVGSLLMGSANGYHPSWRPR